MRLSKYASATIFIGLFILLFSCNKEKQISFTINGTISNADSTTLYVERRGLSETIVLDSLKLDKEGHFEVKIPTVGYTEFYRMKLNKQIINFAIDSTESLTIHASKDNFATSYTIENSPTNERIKQATLESYRLRQSLNEINKELQQKKITQEKYIDRFQLALKDYKDKAKQIINSDYVSASAYYTLFQKVDGLLIFDPYDKQDMSAFRPVATAWDTYHPTSPRSKHLHDFTLAALAENKKADANTQAINQMLSDAPEGKGIYNISLPNLQGNNIDLESLKGKIVILDFTAYQSEYSSARNIELNSIYNRHKGKLEIYQVSFDTDQHLWQNTANNLPWVCVRDTKSIGSSLIAKFNIQNLPSTFLLNRNGDIISRISSLDKIEQEVRRIK